MDAFGACWLLLITLYAISGLSSELPLSIQSSHPQAY